MGFFTEQVPRTILRLPTTVGLRHLVRKKRVRCRTLSRSLARYSWGGYRTTAAYAAAPIFRRPSLTSPANTTPGYSAGPTVSMARSKPELTTGAAARTRLKNTPAARKKPHTPRTSSSQKSYGHWVRHLYTKFILFNTEFIIFLYTIHHF